MGFEYPRADPGVVLHEKLEREKTRESFSHAYTNNSHEDSGILEARYRDLTDTEVQLNKMTIEYGERDIHAATLRVRRYPEIVDILLERDANAKDLSSIRCSPYNKSTSNLLMEFENRKKSDEYRIEFGNPEFFIHARNNTIRNRTHDEPRSINYPLKNAYRNSYSSNPCCPSNREALRFIKKRVTIHLLGQCRNTSQGQHGKLIMLPGSIEELLKIAGKL